MVDVMGLKIDLVRCTQLVSPDKQATEVIAIEIDGQPIPGNTEKINAIVEQQGWTKARVIMAARLRYQGRFAKTPMDVLVPLLVGVKGLP